MILLIVVQTFIVIVLVMMRRKNGDKKKYMEGLRWRRKRKSKIGREYNEELREVRNVTVLKRCIAKDYDICQKKENNTEWTKIGR